jgi:hypothetical protein
MPWKNYDPILQMPNWYDKLSTDGVLIPTTDDIAYTINRDFRWAYNKLTITQMQNIPCGPVGTLPTEYPVCVKPIMNLMGGSIQSEVCHDEEDYNDIAINPGCFWSRYAMGEHYSIDFLLDQGHNARQFVFRGEKLQHGAFDYWEYIGELKDIIDFEAKTILRRFVDQNFFGYSGVVNIEIIGTQIIEVQLRMGDIDRFGDVTIMQTVYDLYNENDVSYMYEDNWGRKESFYLAALFAQHADNFTLNFDALDYIIGDYVTYYQIDDPSLWHTNPSHGKRVALFCGDDWDSVAWARNIAAAMFKPDIDGRYLSPLKDYQELSL